MDQIILIVEFPLIGRKPSEWKWKEEERQIEVHSAVAMMLCVKFIDKEVASCQQLQSLL